MIYGGSWSSCTGIGRCTLTGLRREISKLRKSSWQTPSENLSALVLCRVLREDSQHGPEHRGKRVLTRERNLHSDKLDRAFRFYNRGVRRRIIGFSHQIGRRSPKRPCNQMDVLRAKGTARRELVDRSLGNTDPTTKLGLAHTPRGQERSKTF